MQNPFYWPKLKIERAKQHIEDLDKVIKEFISTDFCRIAVEEDPKTEEYVLSYKLIKSIPECIPLIVGDVIHNMHSALDIMICNIVRLHGGTARYGKFPFYDSKSALIAALQGSELRIAGSRLISLIVDTIKPYKGGNDFLYALHDMDINDKHILVLPIISITALTNVSGTAGGFTFTNCTFAVEGNRKLNILRMPGKFEFQGYGIPVITLVFPMGEPLEGQPIIPALKLFTEIVSDIVESFELHLSATEKP